MNRIWEGTSELAKALKANNTIQELSLSSELHERAFIELLNSFLEMPKTVNNFGNEGIASVASFLSVNTTLEMLYLDGLDQKSMIPFLNSTHDMNNGPAG